MCGISALILADQSASACPDLFESLGLLQHRGQDAAGIVTSGPKGRLYQCKGNGMVRDVFEESQLARLIGSLGIGHVRYPTAGSSSTSEAQPFYVNSPYGITFAHNGNLTNADELRMYLDKVAHRHINTDSDSELLLNILADNLQKTGKARVNEEDIFAAIKQLHQQCRGGYACVAMIAGYGIIGIRDPHGIRPLIMGSRKNPAGYDYMFASESVVLEALGFTNFEDVKPGEAIIITQGGHISRCQLIEGQKISPCIFEYVYFARQDSIMDGISVYKARLSMGEALADQVTRSFGKDMDIDVVIPVPDTSRVAALQLSKKLNIAYREGFNKNRYVGRTFIMPGQQTRRKNVRRKLNAMALEFQDKNVLLVDDSIVRGTTSKEIIQMAREAGAKKVYFASCAPPIRFPNVYGIDMPTRHELVAHERSEQEVAEVIGADKVIYQDLDDLVQSVRRFNPSIETFDTSVFDKCYITGDIDEKYMAHLEGIRNDDNQSRLSMDSDCVGLYNSFQGK
ncbi:phosphoribosyltransferase-like protein [Gilbertella persicaria]|uniref:phosphoribosyltransferase-like protein n=1 Tax=Gilbertella persicaria TaxID=101096 RepID=UPI00221F52A9|nr:phosphoribosyltransferase-like protein [Gilbertella persicaria]KAI8059438.1 phosphoribosyltransferase-like protein [Gilbertella persicaria]